MIANGIISIWMLYINNDHSLNILFIDLKRVHIEDVYFIPISKRYIIIFQLSNYTHF